MNEQMNRVSVVTPLHMTMIRGVNVCSGNTRWEKWRECEPRVESGKGLARMDPMLWSWDTYSLVRAISISINQRKSKIEKKKNDDELIHIFLLLIIISATLCAYLASFRLPFPSFLFLYITIALPISLAPSLFRFPSSHPANFASVPSKYPEASFDVQRVVNVSPLATSLYQPAGDDRRNEPGGYTSIRINATSSNSDSQ